LNFRLPEPDTGARYCSLPVRLTGRMCAHMLNLIAGLLLLCAFPAWGQGEPLFEATAAGRLDEVERLLGARAAVNARNADGETPLYIATEHGHKEVARFLLDKGGDVKIATRNGETVLHAAALNGDPDLMTLLLARGAEVNRANLDGERPLSWAAMAARTKMLWTQTATARCTVPRTAGTKPPFGCYWTRAPTRPCATAPAIPRWISRASGVMAALSICCSEKPKNRP